jgi:hypothetical protein
MPDETSEQQEEGLKKETYSEIGSKLEKVSKQFIYSVQAEGKEIANIPLLVKIDIEDIAENGSYVNDTNGEFRKRCGDFIQHVENAKTELDYLWRSREEIHKIRKILEKKTLESVRSRDEPEMSPITYDGVDPDTIYQKIVPKITQEIDLRRICLSVRTRGQISDLSYENLRGQTLNERVHHLIEICTVKSKLDVLIEVCIAQDIIKKGTI